MQINDELQCPECGDVIILDALDLEEGFAYCIQCGEEIPIEAENYGECNFN